MEEIVEGEMPEHDENRVVTVLTVLGRPAPVTRRQLANSLDQSVPIVDVPAQRIVQIHPQKQIVWIALAWIVRGDNRCWRRQDQLQTIEKESMNDREMARVLVRRPFLRCRSPLEYGRPNLPHQRHHN